MNAENLKASLGIEKLSKGMPALINDKLKEIAETKKEIASLQEATTKRNANTKAIKEQIVAKQALLKTQQGELNKTLDEVRPDQKKVQLTGKQIGATVGTAAVAGIFSIMMSHSAGKQAEDAGKAWGTGVSNGIMGDVSGAMIGGQLGGWD